MKIRQKIEPQLIQAEKLLEAKDRQWPTPIYDVLKRLVTCVKDLTQEVESLERSIRR